MLIYLNKLSKQLSRRKALRAQAPESRLTMLSAMRENSGSGYDTRNINQPIPAPLLFWDLDIYHMRLDRWVWSRPIRWGSSGSSLVFWHCDRPHERYRCWCWWRLPAYVLCSYREQLCSWFERRTTPQRYRAARSSKSRRATAPRTSNGGDIDVYEGRERKINRSRSFYPE